MVCNHTCGGDKSFERTHLSMRARTYICTTEKSDLQMLLARHSTSRKAPFTPPVAPRKSWSNDFNVQRTLTLSPRVRVMNVCTPWANCYMQSRTLLADALLQTIDSELKEWRSIYSGHRYVQTNLTSVKLIVHKWVCTLLCISTTTGTLRASRTSHTSRVGDLPNQ